MYQFLTQQVTLLQEFRSTSVTLGPVPDTQGMMEEGRLRSHTSTLVEEGRGLREED